MILITFKFTSEQEKAKAIIFTIITISRIKTNCQKNND